MDQGGFSLRQAPPAALPDPADLLARHRLPRLAGEGAGELGHVGDHAVDAVLAGRVRVGAGAQALGLRARVAARPLRETDEEALVGGEPVLRQEVLAGGLGSAESG